jgi:hypothetical protein
MTITKAPTIRKRGYPPPPEVELTFKSPMVARHAIHHRAYYT